jgi:hypothetical protein
MTVEDGRNKALSLSILAWIADPASHRWYGLKSAAHKPPISCWVHHQAQAGEADALAAVLRYQHAAGAQADVSGGRRAASTLARLSARSINGPVGWSSVPAWRLVTDGDHRRPCPLSAD